MTTDEEVQGTKPPRTILKQDRDREVHISGRRVGSSLQGWASPLLYVKPPFWVAAII
ncbi:leucine-rich repeat extensin-like protein 3 [Iris pallida]|uniref:Leucine-rich repeat extensin-like protein 3 n=1 Tax=Iris pallida TaxID=29817 RepID=A0AAX6FFN6_IRIPA|nr:leucine-rich repeat extensin-like protein 3 [Iris pallida]